MQKSKSAPSLHSSSKSVKIRLKADDVPHAVLWTRRERIEWTIMLLVGSTILFSARTILPLCAVDIAKEFGWDKAETGLVLACFLWGYPCTQIPGGYLSDKIGGDLVLYRAALVWGVVTIVTAHVPYLYSSKAASIFTMAFIRFLLGITQGVHYPSMSSLISKKVNMDNKPSVISVIFAASSAGTLFTGAVGSIMLLYFHWQAIFYFVGFLGIAWGLFVRWYVRKHSKRTVYVLHNGRHEENGIKTKTDERETGTMQGGSHFPWRELITKKPFWAVLCGHSCTNFLFFILISWTPTYFTEVFPGQKGWVFNVLPWLVAIPASLGAGFVATKLLAMGCPVALCRKSIHTLSCIGMSISLIAVCFAKEYNTALTLIIIAVASQSFSNAGVQVNIQDIAPKHAGAVYGITNCGGAIAGFAGTYLTGYILHLWYSWPAVFSMAVAVVLFGWSMFVNWGSAVPVI
ncbi:solute carrier family 17 member 9-like [Patiria miniata]|uniref:Major facilitator superfamily (MFS) profile domain-containing protein n=1 Tax=Patiria miniata TaxID=46514 RepID=A0A914A1F3_PATMI|nr:solute carrier family 17 member 9-like [Patiria miniata]